MKIRTPILLGSMVSNCNSTRKLQKFQHETLFALPVRRALVEEGIHSLAEVFAHIGAKDQILALVARQRPPDTAHRLLGDFERDRSMDGEQRRRLAGAARQRRDIRY